MRIETHNQTDIDVNMTCLQGRLFDVKYSQLVELFGEPLEGTDKTDAEWLLEIEDEEGNIVVATIYNWKNGHNYCGADGEDTEDITEWNIGGKKSAAAHLVQEYIKNNIK